MVEDCTDRNGLLMEERDRFIYADDFKKLTNEPPLYRSLKLNQIRLLVVNPGAEKEHLECFLRYDTKSDSADLHYEALSYSWGDASDRADILLDGRKVSITRSLWNFLLHYRLQNCCVVLWIDALCINQADMVERREQIAFMKDIYEGATRVLIWLGTEAEHSIWAYHLLYQIYYDLWLPRVKEKGSEAAAQTSISRSDLPLIIDLPKFRRKDIDDSTSTRIICAEFAWDALQELFERPWWSRAWVYQEATTPCRGDTMLLCGPHILPFKAALIANQLIRHFGFGGARMESLQKYGSLRLTYMQQYYNIRRELRSSGKSEFLSLEDLLSVVKELQATDPRDKIFALLAMSLDGHEIIHPDYRSPVEEVFHNAAVAFIQRFRNLDILGHCSPNRQNDGLKLPSWVPDWTCSTAPSRFMKKIRDCKECLVKRVGFDRYETCNHKDGRIDQLYCATLKTKTDIDAIGIDSSILCCKGYYWDTVRLVSDRSNDKFGFGSVLKEWKEWLQSRGIDVQSNLPSYPGGTVSIKAALSCTLTADCERMGIDIGRRGCRAIIEIPEEYSWMTPEEVDDYLYNDPGAEAGLYGCHPSTFRRKLFVTDNGYLGLTAEHVEPNDRVVLLMGGQLPFVLRQIENDYTLIGEAYVHGIMDGEGMKGVGDSMLSPFRLR